jgi:small GTP-binding protein
MDDIGEFPSKILDNSSKGEDSSSNFSNMSNKDESEQILIYPDNYQKYDLSFKIVLLGNSGVGKTCITKRAIKSEFKELQNLTVGMEFYTIFVKVENKLIRLQLWDTCGEEKYRALVTNFYRNSSLAILVYAIDDSKSFRDLDSWVKELRQNNSPSIKLFLVGNKIDLLENKEVTKEMFDSFCDLYHINDYIETSAKTGENICKMFVNIAKKLYEDYCLFEQSSEQSSVKTNSVLDRANIKVKKRCCS